MSRSLFHGVYIIDAFVGPPVSQSIKWGGSTISGMHTLRIQGKPSLPSIAPLPQSPPGGSEASRCRGGQGARVVRADLGSIRRQGSGPGCGAQGGLIQGEGGEEWRGTPELDTAREATACVDGGSHRRVSKSLMLSFGIPVCWQS